LHNYSQTKDKGTRLEITSSGTGPKINRKRTKLMKMNTTANTPITVSVEPIGEVVESFVYLGGVVDKQRGTYRYVTARNDKARGDFVMLKNFLTFKHINVKGKIAFLTPT
jgi:DNA-binding beta-propeller fold protein YncE